MGSPARWGCKSVHEVKRRLAALRAPGPTFCNNRAPGCRCAAAARATAAALQIPLWGRPRTTPPARPPAPAWERAGRRPGSGVPPASAAGEREGSVAAQGCCTRRAQHPAAAAPARPPRLALKGSACGLPDARSARRRPLPHPWCGAPHLQQSLKAAAVHRRRGLQVRLCAALPLLKVCRCSGRGLRRRGLCQRKGARQEQGTRVRVRVHARECHPAGATARLAPRVLACPPPPTFPLARCLKKRAP
jgi:hypothetical protein